MRTKSIILGAIAALALVTLSANAGNRATPQAQGTLVSLLAATTTVAKADREAEATAAPAATHTEATEAVAKCVASGGEADAKDCHRAKKDGAAVLQLLDHGMKTRAFVRIYEQPPGTIAGHGRDEPLLYSDELSEVK